MDCEYENDWPFEFPELLSSPVDTLIGICPEGASDGNVCYDVNGGFISYLFYKPVARRQLEVQNKILDMRLVQVYGDYLDELFDNGWLRGNYEEIQGMDFMGFTNINTATGTFDGEVDDGDDGAAGLNRGDPDQLDDGKKLPVIIAGFALAVAAIVLIVVVVMGFRRRRREREAEELYEERKMGDKSYDQYTYDEEYDAQETPSSSSKRHPMVADEDESVEQDVFVDYVAPPTYRVGDDASQDRSYEVDDTVDL